MTDSLDAIAAIATPPGTSGIAVIRVSGAGSIEKIAEVFQPSRVLSEAPSHTLHYGTVRTSGDELLDEVVVAVFRSPRSYTGEDSIEISCHGGTAVSQAVLSRVLQTGIRPAEAGEFTRRALLNGKLDLVQAEAVADLIHAETEAARNASLRQLEGTLSAYVREIRDGMIRSASMLELSLDFVEEDVEFLSLEDLRKQLDQARALLLDARGSYGSGRIIREGFRSVLLGAPNVGKSSLLNALLGSKRAIVTDVPGTTRDYIEEQVLIDGVLFRIVDTAGLRDTDDTVEKEGIAFSTGMARDADMLILIHDAQTGEPGTADRRIAMLDIAAGSVVLNVFNKSDLLTSQQRTGHGDDLLISALTGDGLNGLKRRMVQESKDLMTDSEKGQVIVTNARHADCLARGIAAIESAQTVIEQGMTEEVVAFELRQGIDALGEIIGEVTSEEILNSI